MNRFTNDSAIDLVAVTSSEQSIGGVKAPEPVVRVKPSMEASVDIPDSIGGINIKKERGNPKRGTVAHGGCHNNDKFDPFPGGVKTVCIVSDEYGNPYENIGTSGYITNKDGAYYAVSAAHLTVYGCDHWQQNDFWNPDGFSNDVGAASDGDTLHDWVVYSADSSDIDTLDAAIINSSDGVEYGTVGYYTYDGLQYHMNQGTMMTKQGQTIGSESNPIKYINTDDSPSNCDLINMDGYGVSLHTTTATGDSGGPIYRATQNYYGDDISIIVGHVSMGVHPALGSPACDNIADPEMYDWATGWPAYKMANLGYSAGSAYDS
jgi:hypothetical protein